MSGFIQRPLSEPDFILRLKLTVTQEFVDLVSSDGLATQRVERPELARIFSQSGIPLRDGVFQIEFSEKGIEVEDPANIYTPEEWLTITAREKPFWRMLFRTRENLLLSITQAQGGDRVDPGDVTGIFDRLYDTFVSQQGESGTDDNPVSELDTVEF